MGGARALLFPLDWPEPFGLVLIEALASGKSSRASTCPRGVVAENGGVLYWPAAFVAELRRRAPHAFSISETLVATVKPHEHVALDLIRDLGLELQIVFNGDAVMVLAPGISKATGLFAALANLGLSPLNVVGVGDAENDHALLGACGVGIAVANALPALRMHADSVTPAAAGEGVAELIDALVADDLGSIVDASRRNRIVLGERRDAPGDAPATLPLHGTVALLVGPSGCGKSTAAAGMMERLANAGCQLCTVDPEGDFSNDDTTIVLGDARTAPSIDEVVHLLDRPGRPSR
jgi:hypothetical protein